MTGNGLIDFKLLKLPKLLEKAGILIEMAGNGLKWLVRAGNGWKQFELG